MLLELEREFGEGSWGGCGGRGEIPYPTPVGYRDKAADGVFLCKVLVYVKCVS